MPYFHLNASHGLIARAALQETEDAVAAAAESSQAPDITTEQPVGPAAVAAAAPSPSSLGSMPSPITEVQPRSLQLLLLVGTPLTNLQVLRDAAHHLLIFPLTLLPHLMIAPCQKRGCRTHLPAMLAESLTCTHRWTAVTGANAREQALSWPRPNAA